MNTDTIAAVGTIVAIVVPILISHERRLTRIESKIDMILRFINGGKNEN